jgi:hypothetical protein
MEVATAEPPRVFINCPYDEQYEPLRNVLILSCVACGFYPSSAIDKGGGGRPRISRIIDELRRARYSIHDLTRSIGVAEGEKARINMALELGMAVYRAHHDEQHHDWLALIPNGDEHLDYVSDLGGFDPAEYDGTDRQLVRKVVGFLAVQDEAPPGIDPQLVFDAVPEFEAKLQLAVTKWDREVPWRTEIEVATDALKRAREPAN